MVALALLLPSTLGADFWSMPGFGFVADSLLRVRHPGLSAMVLAAIVTG